MEVINVFKYWLADLLGGIIEYKGVVYAILGAFSVLGIILLALSCFSMFLKISDECRHK